MSVVAFRDRVVRRRRRRLIPRKRILKTRSIFPKRTIYIHKGRFRLFKHRDNRRRFFRRFNMYVIPSTRSEDKSFSQRFNKKTQTRSKSKDWSPKKSVGTKTKKDWSAEKQMFKNAWAGGGYRRMYKPDLQQDAMNRHKENFAKWLEKDFKQISKQFVNKDWRGGDYSRYRKKPYVNYGPMKALGPKLIFRIDPTKEFARHYSIRKQKFGDILTIKYLIENAMNRMLDSLKVYAGYIINKYVPKDTGALRQAMMASINKSRVDNFSVAVYLDTGGIQYANPVNNMPQGKLRHFKESGRRSRRAFETVKKTSKPRSTRQPMVVPKFHTMGYTTSGINSEKQTWSGITTGGVVEFKQKPGHALEWYEKGRGKLLDDPKAVSGWWQFVDMQLNTKAKELIKIMLREITAAWSYAIIPSGYKHPASGFMTKRVESDYHREKRMKALDAYGREYKNRIKGKYKTRIEHREFHEDWKQRTRVVRAEEKEVPIRSNDWDVTLREMRTRRHKQQINRGRGPNAKLFKQKQPVIEYPYTLIKKMFKIRGLNKR